MRRWSCSHAQQLVSLEYVKDNTIIGAFTFKKAQTFIKYSKELIKKNKRINNEFYLDSVANLCISHGLKVKINLVEKYIGWGTPDDLENYKKSND